MADAWTEGAQRMWDGWADAFMSPTALRPPPTADPLSEAAVKALRAWIEQAVPYTNSVVGRLLPGPEPLTSLFGATLAVWEAMARQAVAGPGSQGMFDAYADQFQRPFRLPEFGTAVQDLTELWTLYTEELQKLCRPWFEAAAGATDPLDPTAHESGLVRFTDLSWDVFERTFGRLLQSPSVGFTRELNEKLFGAFSSWLEFRRANLDYQVAVSTALARSTTQFLQQLAAKAGKGEAIGGLRELLRLWGDTLDEILIESFRSEEYAEVQGRLVHAAMAYRMREREAIDVLLKIGHVPTRRDIDDVSRSLYELRKEVRGLAKVAANGKQAPVRAEAPAGPAAGVRTETEPQPPAATKATTKPKPAAANKATTKPTPAAKAGTQTRTPAPPAAARAGTTEPKPPPGATAEGTPKPAPGPPGTAGGSNRAEGGRQS